MGLPSNLATRFQKNFVSIRFSYKNDDTVWSSHHELQDYSNHTSINSEYKSLTLPYGGYEHARDHVCTSDKRMNTWTRWQSSTNSPTDNTLEIKGICLYLQVSSLARLRLEPRDKNTTWRSQQKPTSKPHNTTAPLEKWTTSGGLTKRRTISDTSS